MKSVFKQRTVGRSGILKGVGLHTGVEGSVTVKPSAANRGVRFFRKGKEIGRLGTDAQYLRDSRPRCSFIGEGENQLLTVEHLLAACQGLGVTNADIEVEGPEVPALDGSAKPFVDFLKRLGLEEQGSLENPYRIQEPIFCHDKGKALCALPADELVISYVLDYDHPYLRDQKVQFTVTPVTFESGIAPARTFCTAQEVGELKNAGFGLGGNAENTLVIPERGLDQTKLRFPDECARHKVLDLLGDLALLGAPLVARIIGLRSGHRLNRQLVHEIMKQRGLHGQHQA